MPRIGFDNVYYAKLLTDDIAACKATYGPLKRLKGAIKAGVEHSSDSATLDSDDHVSDIVTGYGSTSVTLDLRDLTPEAACDLQGHTLSAAGGVIRSAADNAPFVALVYRSLKSDGTYQYCVLYKGKFQLVGSNAETKKKGGVTFQTPSLKGDFIARDCDGRYEYYVDESPESAEEIESWFDQVPEAMAA